MQCSLGALPQAPNVYCVWLLAIDFTRVIDQSDLVKVFYLVLKLIVILSFIGFPSGHAANSNAYDDATLVVTNNVTMVPINPFFTQSTMAANLLNIIYDPLVRYTVDGNLKPLIAREWNVSPDGLTWTFLLHDDVRFHSGETLTAHDVKSTYEALLSMRGGFHAFGFANVKDIEAPSNNKLIVHLKRYDSFLPFFLTHAYIVPSSLIQTGIDSMPVIGSGPYRLHSFSPEQAELVAFQDYFDGRPLLDRIIIRIYPNQRTCLAKLVSGEADMLLLLTDILDYDVFANIDKYEVLETPMGFRYWVLFNVRHPILKDKNVRSAFSRLMDNVEADDGDGKLWQGDDDLSDTVTLLEEEGWRDTDGDYFLDRNGNRLQIRILLSDDDDVSKRIVQQLSDRFEQVGIRVEYDVTPSYKELLVKGFADRDYDLMLIPSNARSSILQQYLFWHSSQIEKGGNSGGYSNPEVDRLLDEIRYNPDPSARKKAEKDLAKALYDDPPGVPLFVKQTPMLVNKKFIGFSSDPFEFFSSFRNVKIRKGSD